MKKTKKFRNSFSNPLDVHKLANKISKTKVKKFGLKTVVNIFLYSVLTLLFIVALMFAWFSKDLPTPGKIKHRYVSQSSQIYARDGKTPLYTISGEFKRTVITKDQMPKSIRDATVAMEDKDFYHHIGIDFKGITRAILANLTHKAYSQGGSTITQQFVKNALLTSEKSLPRKIKEIILSLEIEIMYNKQDILTMYLNEVPFGSNAYGIEAASQIYYNKSAKDLTLDESATLASLIQAPTYYYNHRDVLQDRRNITLKKMTDQGYITKQEKIDAQAKPIQFIPRKENIQAPHFVMYVKEVLVEKYGEKMVESGGLKVVTTLDMDKQKLAEQALTDNIPNLKKYGASNAALVSIDPKTGQILSMVGSVNYFDAANDGNFNVATATRQPGSSIKPIVYATGFEGKYNPGSILFDLKTDFGKYVPKNYDGSFRGPVTIRQALGNSLNIPAVKMLGIVGIDKMIDTASKMGITTLNDPSKYGLSLALGAGEVRPLDMATAYSVFANNGVLAKTTPILKVEDANGKVLEEWKPKQNDKKVLDPQAAYEISSVLSDLNAKKPVFTFALNNLSLKDRPVASKTGTTNDYKDAWTVGYTPNLVTAVWAGNNNNKPMTPSGGSIGAAPIWHEYMQNALQSMPKEDFVRPAGIQELTVEKYSNKLPSDLSKEFIKDIFASWQVPTEKDDVHVKINVCRSNGLLAPKNLPADQTEQKIFSNVHSEFPDRANWEAPVRAWASAAGMYNPIPDKYCKAGDVVAPKVSITEPADNATVSGTFNVTAAVDYNGTINNVEFFIDDIKIGSADNSPYTISYNTNNLSAGVHVLSARANGPANASGRTNINIKVGNDTTPPGNVIGLDGTKDSSNKIVLNWTNPTDDDLSVIRIYQSQTNLANNGFGTIVGEYPASIGQPQNSPPITLKPGLNCFYVFTADKSNNSNQSLLPYCNTGT